MARIKIVERKQKKEIKKHKPKSKKKAKEILILPRLRLEPTLKPKKNSKQTTENTELSNLSCLKQVIVEAVKLPDTINFESVNDSASSTIKYPAADENLNFDSDSFLETEENIDILRTEKKKNQGNRLWKDSELLSLATGLQTYGFRETKKIAELIKTKDENHVEHFIKCRTVHTINTKNAQKRRGRPENSWYRVNSENVPSWPNVRKWRRMAHDQMLALVRAKDYSRTVIVDLLQKFYDEEEEPSDPQVINVKSVYKYLLDCLAGKIPAQLPPKESALVLDLLRDLRLLPLVYDFQEEKTFLENYKEATRYKPFQVKDEFKKRFSNVNLDLLFDRNCVSVPEEVFMNLSRHKRVVQSFNPLVIPVWMMQKEQEYLEKFI